MKLNKEVTIFLSALGLISVLFILNSYFAVEKQKEITITEPYRASFTGEQVCLPLKSTDSLTTLECERGIKTDEGEYYVGLTCGGRFLGSRRFTVVKEPSGKPPGLDR